MALGSFPVASSIAFSVALIITVISGFEVYRQKVTAYQNIRDFLIGVYLLIVILIVLDFARVVDGNPRFMIVYAPVSVTIALLEAIFLISAAVGMYLRPLGSSYRHLLPDILKHPRQMVPFFVFVGIAFLADILLIVQKPYEITAIVTFAGARVWFMKVPLTYISLIVVLLVFFLTYPTLLLIMGARRVSNRRLRRSLIGLPIGWAATSVIYVGFEIYAWTYSVDATAVMYIILAALFALITRNFRVSATLAGFVAAEGAGTATLSPVGSADRFGFISGKKVLMEVDPSSGFESTVTELAKSFVAGKQVVFVFTPKASRIYNALSQIPEVRLYTMATDASYLRPTERPNEVLIPKYDTAMLLDALDKTIASTSGTTIAVFFDNISDLILSSSFEDCYKFLKEANEINNDPRITSIFVILSAAQNEKVTRIVKSLFSTHVLVDEAGLRSQR